MEGEATELVRGLQVFDHLVNEKTRATFKVATLYPLCNRFSDQLSRNGLGEVGMRSKKRKTWKSRAFQQHHQVEESESDTLN